jgi:hypothetical protein
MAKSQLTLVHGGRSAWYRVNGFNCRLANTATFRTLHLDAVVFEEDTHLILTLDRVMTHGEVHPIRLMTELHAARPHTPGSLIINDSSWYGVVIDLDREKICTAEWIDTAYEQVGRRISLKRIQTIGVHLLGTIHGKMDVDFCLDRFVSAVGCWRCESLKEVWLIVSDKSELTTHTLLQAYRN